MRKRMINFGDGERRKVEWTFVIVLKEWKGVEIVLRG
jgi:hypothetical protein